MSSLTHYPTSSSEQTTSRDLMPKTISATEAKAKLSELIKWTVKNQDSVIVKSRGNPQVAIISFSAYEELQTLKEQARRREAFARFEALAKEIQARNKDLTSEAADQIADEITRAAIDSLVTKGEVRFTE